MAKEKEKPCKTCGGTETIALGPGDPEYDFDGKKFKRCPKCR